MKILVVNNTWAGGWMNHVVEGLISENHEVHQIRFSRGKNLHKHLKLSSIIQIKNHFENIDIQNFNKKVKLKFDEVKPEIFLTLNQSRLFHSTIRYIQQKDCHTACFIADNPFDSHRYTYLPMSLQYFDKLLVSDRIWIQNIRNVAPSSEIIKIPSGGGYSPQVFYPVDLSEISIEDRLKLDCDISFTGESYGLLAEGGYRACILDQLGNYKVKIWGDHRWELRFPYHRNLKNYYQGERLSYENLRKLYRLSTININIPSPQIYTGFQPRVFEIAGCKGFQIVDYRKELDDYFTVDEIVTFKNPGDLQEKVEYFVKNPEKRESYIEKAYNKVSERFSWETQIREILPLFTF